MKQLLKKGAPWIFAPLAVVSCDKNGIDTPRQGSELILSVAEQQQVTHDNQFALKLFHESTGGLLPRQNALLSPISVSTALAMTHNGAAGETAEAMRKTLQLGDFDTKAVNSYYKKILTALPNLDPATTLNIANSIWHRNAFEVVADFLDVNRDFYQAEVAGLDFSSSQAKETINGWVNKATEGKIPTIIDGNIPADMMVYLINAVYFKGSWQEPFDEQKTSASTFNRLDNSTLQTDFMHITHDFNVAVTNDAEAIELPYGNEKFNMIILKPKGDMTPAELAEKLATTDAWLKINEAFGSRKTQLALPKFKFSYENELNDELSKLGMGIAFSDGADFSGISKEQSLKISKVKHKSFIEVNEEGTEAAAATSVGIVVTSMPQLYRLQLDEPFIFAIREADSGLILFLGQVNDPSVSESKG